MEEIRESEYEIIDPRGLESPVRTIGDEWMLICSADRVRPEAPSNAMTASWGCIGVLWGKPVAVCFIRPQRYTHGLVEAEEYLSLNFFSGAYKKELAVFGRESGRDADKFALTGMHRACLDGVPCVGEAQVVLLCRKIYVGRLEKSGFLDPALFSHYPEDDFHDVYVCEIIKAVKRK